MAKPRVSVAFDRAGMPPPELAFPRAEYAARWAKTKALMARDGVDVLYATSPAHMCWLHGYHAAWYRTHAPSTWGAMLGTAVALDWDQPIHFDAIGEDALLYKTSVAEDIRFFDDRSPEGQPPFIARELQKSGLLKPGTVVGLEKRSHQPNRLFSEMIEAALVAAGARVVDASMILREARREKSPAELEVMAEAMRIAEIGIQAATTAIRPGVMELDIQAEMLAAMCHAGGELAAIPIMVQSGPDIGGHQMPRRRRIEAGDHVKIDMCGVHHRYHANILRGFSVGAPSDALRDRYRRAGGAYDVFCREAWSGRPVRETNAALRDYYASVGLADEPGWCIGYELGIAMAPDWVDEFNFSYDETDTDAIWPENFVGNFESLFTTGLVDTYVVQPGGTQKLCTVPFDLIVVA